MLSDRHQADELPQINMTPMVDVAFMYGSKWK